MLCSVTAPSVCKKNPVDHEKPLKGAVNKGHIYIYISIYIYDYSIKSLQKFTHKVTQPEARDLWILGKFRTKVSAYSREG